MFPSLISWSLSGELFWVPAISVTGLFISSTYKRVNEFEPSLIWEFNSAKQFWMANTFRIIDSHTITCFLALYTFSLSLETFLLEDGEFIFYCIISFLMKVFSGIMSNRFTIISSFNWMFSFLKTLNHPLY